ncbi:M28 family peptidase [Aquisalibacillus elongatus]|uniref:Zn-dependent M28 family amino/carboxypeptidase n=1 Tax=Aquisalibacillus elongatus TaxID=485577 RepID=A0A3N5BG36_9BACI|nr:M28 family peptidase [Aquisalibacillus elongatus]RPF54230.1 Zn-dependent M28 family amino/carboxypeptidase [Aquisalibacillus elongatus]
MSVTEWVESVQQDDLMEHTRQIAQYERLSGTREELKAFQYIYETLSSYGLKPELIEHDAFISLPKSANLVVNGEEFQCITHSMAPSEPGLTAPLKFINKNQLSSLDDQNGKIAIIHGLAAPGTVRNLQKLGFAAAIFINTSLTYEMIVSPVWGNPTPEKMDDFPTIPVISVTKETGERLIQLADSNHEAYLQTQVDTRIRKIPLLTVDIESKGDQEDFILFSGHVDSWHYGAMDNGTANATMLEVARITNEHRDELKRNLRLAFWSGHSHGRYAGSAYYADQHWLELYEHCVAHVNIDSVGGQNATVLTQANCMAETKDIATHSVGELTGQQFEGKRYGKAGDQSFWGIGIPSLYMGLSEQPPTDSSNMTVHEEMFGQSGKSTGFGWWWHTPEDLVDKIDPAFLERDCQVYVHSIHQLLTKPKLPINQLAAIEDIRDGLQTWSEKLQSSISLQHLVKKLCKIEERLKVEQEELSVDQYNQLNMKLSRKLVPFNYVQSSVFDYDTLFSLPKVPALLEVDRLITLDPSSNEYFFSKTKVQRIINELEFQLKEVETIINSFH